MATADIEVIKTVPFVDLTSDVSDEEETPEDGTASVQRIEKHNGVLRTEMRLDTSVRDGIISSGVNEDKLSKENRHLASKYVNSCNKNNLFGNLAAYFNARDQHASNDNEVIVCPDFLCDKYSSRYRKHPYPPSVLPGSTETSKKTKYARIDCKEWKFPLSEVECRLKQAECRTLREESGDIVQPYFVSKMEALCYHRILEASPSYSHPHNFQSHVSKTETVENFKFEETIQHDIMVDSTKREGESTAQLNLLNQPYIESERMVISSPNLMIHFENCDRDYSIIDYDALRKAIDTVQTNSPCDNINTAFENTGELEYSKISDQLENVTEKIVEINNMVSNGLKSVLPNTLKSEKSKVDLNDLVMTSDLLSPLSVLTEKRIDNISVTSDHIENISNRVDDVSPNQLKSEVSKDDIVNSEVTPLNWQISVVAEKKSGKIFVTSDKVENVSKRIDYASPEQLKSEKSKDDIGDSKLTSDLIWPVPALTERNDTIYVTSDHLENISEEAETNNLKSKSNDAASPTALKLKKNKNDLKDSDVTSDFLLPDSDTGTFVGSKTAQNSKKSDNEEVRNNGTNENTKSDSKELTNMNSKEGNSIPSRLFYGNRVKNRSTFLVESANTGILEGNESRKRKPSEIIEKPVAVQPEDLHSAIHDIGNLPASASLDINKNKSYNLGKHIGSGRRNFYPRTFSGFLYRPPGYQYERNRTGVPLAKVRPNLYPNIQNTRLSLRRPHPPLFTRLPFRSRPLSLPRLPFRSRPQLFPRLLFQPRPPLLPRLRSPLLPTPSQPHPRSAASQHADDDVDHHHPNESNMQNTRALLCTPPPPNTRAPLCTPPPPNTRAPLCTPPPPNTRAPLYTPPPPNTVAPLYTPPPPNIRAPLYTPPPPNIRAPLRTTPLQLSVTSPSPSLPCPNYSESLSVAEHLNTHCLDSASSLHHDQHNIQNGIILNIPSVTTAPREVVETPSQMPPPYSSATSPEQLQPSSLPQLPDIFRTFGSLPHNQMSILNKDCASRPPLPIQSVHPHTNSSQLDTHPQHALTDGIRFTIQIKNDPRIPVSRDKVIELSEYVHPTQNIIQHTSVNRGNEHLSGQNILSGQSGMPSQSSLAVMGASNRNGPPTLPSLPSPSFSDQTVYKNLSVQPDILGPPSVSSTSCGSDLPASKLFNVINSVLTSFEHLRQEKVSEDCTSYSATPDRIIPQTRKPVITCLVPRHLKQLVGHEIILTSRDVHLIILEWSTDEIEQNWRGPPRICNVLKKVLSSYSSFADYYHTYFPLMLYETWQRICADWNKHIGKPPYSCDITAYKPKSNYVRVECQTVLKDQDCKRLSVREGHILIVRYVNKSSHRDTINMLGYVTSVVKRPFKHITDSKICGYEPPTDGNYVNDKNQVISLSFSTAYDSTEIDTKSPARIHVLCDVMSSLKQSNALVRLQKSPLLGSILNPTKSGLEQLTFTTRSASEEQKKECLQSIAYSISAPHPQPCITVVRSTPETDRLGMIPALIAEIKSSYQRKVLLCVASGKSLTEFAANICLHDDLKLVIICREDDISSLYHGYVLEVLVNVELQGKVAHLRKKAAMDTRKQILQECDVVLSTLETCHNKFIEETFTEVDIAQMCCIVDDAHKHTEPETLIPLMYGLSKLILIGNTDDQHDFVFSTNARKHSYDKSLFKRAYEVDFTFD